jgi:hypothetical protein
MSTDGVSALRQRMIEDMDKTRGKAALPRTEL